MSTPPRPISDLELSPGEEITLYKELIRIIERDIDEIKAGDTKNGWTSWALMGALIGAVTLLFGELRKLQTIPGTEVLLVILAALSLNYFVTTASRLFNLGLRGIKPGRILWSKDINYHQLPSSLYTMLVQVSLMVITWSSHLPTSIKIASLSALGYSTALGVLYLVLALIKYPIGGNKVSKKSAPVFGLVGMALAAITLTLSVRALPLPLGEASVISYTIGGLISLILILLGHLVVIMGPSRLRSNLMDLRDEIIFLRIDIDEGLKRYETLIEGETLPDALKEDLASVIGDLDFLSYAQSNMDALTNKIANGLPSETDSQELRNQKLKQLTLDFDSFYLHDTKCQEVLVTMGKKLQKLNKKLSQYAAIAEDWAGENVIRTTLSQRLATTERLDRELRQRVQGIQRQVQGSDVG